jgi:hypothetical protein
MTTPESERFDMNAVLRAATGRGQTTETEPDTTDESSSNAEPEPELSMNDLIRRAFGRSHSNLMSNPARRQSRSQTMCSTQCFEFVLVDNSHSVCRCLARAMMRQKMLVDQGNVLHLIMVLR